MSGVKHFHKKEAARILIELQSKTEDVRLMNYRRQLLNKDSNMDEFRNSSDVQDRMDNNYWPWIYPNLAVPQYNLNTVPIGYPTWTPNPQFWFSNSTSYIPETATSPFNLHPQAFPGLDYPANLPWPMSLSYHQAYVDPRHCNRRRRTKFTNEQLAVLEKSFTEGSKFPSPGERMELESQTGLSKEKISVWFQNRRAKEKREKGQEGGIKEETSTTTDSELETEDERQLSICDETPEEGSEIEDTRNNESNTSGDIEDPEPEETTAVDSSGHYPSEHPEETIDVHQRGLHQHENVEESIVIHPSRVQHNENPEKTIVVHPRALDHLENSKGTIAVHPSGVYHSENPAETVTVRPSGRYPNINPEKKIVDHSRKLHHDTSPEKEIAVHPNGVYHSENPAETITVRPSGRYPNLNPEKKIVDHSSKLYHDTSPEKEIDVHPSGLYHNENEITLSLLPSMHLTTSYRDKQPRKRDINDTTSIDEKLDASAKNLGRNDVFMNANEDIDNVEDSDGLKDDSDEDFTFQNKKIKVEEEDILSTNTVATQTNLCNEYRVFGET